MAPKPKEDPDAPDAGWSDEEKADWEQSAKSRERLKAELTDGIVSQLKDLFFNDPGGGELTDPPEPTGGTPVPEEVKPYVPFWDRQLFGKKAKAAS